MTENPADDRPRIEPEPPHRELERPSIPPRILALVALGVVLIVIAVGFGFARERIARMIGPAPPVSEGQERVQMRQRIEQLESELDLARRQAATRPEPVVVPTEDGEAVVVDPLQLEDRIAALEQSQARMSRAAAAAVAAAALADAAEGSEPFAGELASLERLAPTSRGIRALRDLAEQGAPTRAALVGEFPAAAARAARAADGEDADGGFFDALARAFRSVFSLRRIGELEGDSVDAILARAERRVREGDIEGALSQLQALPEPAREAMSEWSTRAERRVEIERRINALRAQALGDLSGTNVAETGAPL
jgi:hypothetical protein